MKSERSDKRQNWSDPTKLDRLPPHDEEAEKGVLGCVLMSPPVMGDLLKRFGNDQPFYMVSHQFIFGAMKGLHAEGRDFDLITLQSRLRDRGELDQCGGLAYLSSLPDTVPSAVNLSYYAEIVWEKFLARQIVAVNTLIVGEVYEENGVSERLLAKAKRLQGEIEHQSRRGDITPKYLAVASDFEDGFWAQFFGGGSETPGMELPIPFPLKIRYRESTLVSGDDGSGKSTLLNFFALHLARQMPAGERVLVASMEMPPEVTLWILAAQLLGSKHQPDSTDGRARVINALAWINARFLFYNFTGIADWRDLLDTMEYAATHRGMKVAILDSAMRMGIADDDYALQGLVAARLAQFAKDTNTHVQIVIHENKADASGKARVRGSKLWTANVDNIVQVKLNHKKGEEIGKVEYDLGVARSQSPVNEAEIRKLEGDLACRRKMWDTELKLGKQRYPGTQQNASKRFWFDRECFQFRHHYEDTAVNWLELWTRKGTK